MDNELEIVNNEGIAEAAVDAKPNMLATYGPIVLGSLAAIGAGFLLAKYVIKPAYLKRKALKAQSAKKTEDQPKSEE